MFTKKQGKTKFMYYPIAASVAANKGTLMALSGGTLIVATGTTATYNIVGVLQETISATAGSSTDPATGAYIYANGGNVAIEVPVEKNVTWLADVAGTYASLAVGTYYDIVTAVPSATDATSAGQVNQAATTYQVAFCVSKVSSANAIAEFILNIGVDSKEKSTAT